MVALMVGRELAVVIVIALLAAGGSQLPKLVRALGEGSSAPKPRATDDEGGDADRSAEVSEPDHPRQGD